MLIVGQVAVSLALVAAAILFLRSLTNLVAIDTGFDRRQVVVARVDPGAAGYKVGAGLDAMMTRIEERVAATPGTVGASFALTVFDQGSWSSDDILVPGRRRSPDDPHVDFNLVGAQYLDVMRMPILSGRTLLSSDTTASRRVAVVNETMARQYFGERFPIGRTFTVEDDERPESTDLHDVEVVGVVRDAKYERLRERRRAAAFFPHAQHPGTFLYNLVVRHASDAAAALPAIRTAVADIDPNLPLDDVTTLEHLVDGTVVNSRAIASLSLVFGGLAVGLACIGIYGVTAYGVARRTNELGIRIALGAGGRDVLWLVLGETLRTGLAGIAVGVVIAAAAGRFIRSMLFGLTPYDPTALGIAMAAMIVMALVAGYIPARRATNIDPLSVLRLE